MNKETCHTDLLKRLNCMLAQSQGFFSDNEKEHAFSSDAMEQIKEDGQHILFLMKVINYVHHELDQGNSVSVRTAASAMCMCDRQFYRKMSKLTGYSPIVFIKTLKVRKALLLLETEPPLRYYLVAEHCGFSDYSNFLRSFKSIIGMTPGEYRHLSKKI